MRPKHEIVENLHVPVSPVNLGILGADAHAFVLETVDGEVLVVYSADEDGWEHASVSPCGSKDELDQPCPTWVQMCEFKRALWRDDETVVQMHPREADYVHGVGFDTNILHLWRPVGGAWSMLEKEERNA